MKNEVSDNSTIYSYHTRNDNSDVYSKWSSGSEINYYERGFRVREEHPINQDVYDACGDDNYNGFIEGCTSI